MFVLPASRFRVLSASSKTYQVTWQVSPALLPVQPDTLAFYAGEGMSGRKSRIWYRGVPSLLFSSLFSPPPTPRSAEPRHLPQSPASAATGPARSRRPPAPQLPRGTKRIASSGWLSVQDGRITSKMKKYRKRGKATATLAMSPLSKKKKKKNKQGRATGGAECTVGRIDILLLITDVGSCADLAGSLPSP